MREKRAFEASLPPISDLSQMGLRKKMLEEWERREWEDREQEIVELQEEQLRVLAVEREQREARIDLTSNQRLKALQSRLLHDKQQSLTQLQKQRVKVLRTLGAARQRAEWKVEKNPGPEGAGGGGAALEQLAVLARHHGVAPRDTMKSPDFKTFP